jgi:uncharacterized protein (TIGR02246 family)
MAEVVALYEALLAAWNGRDAAAMAERFADDGELIGVDGSTAVGPREILDHVAPVFRDHPTPRFVHLVREVRPLCAEVSLLRAIAGMVPPGGADILPALNAQQTLLALRIGGEWRIRLFQSTPAQFHGRPELVDRMSQELRRALD